MASEKNMKKVNIIPQYKVVLRDYWSNVVEVAVFPDRDAAIKKKDAWAQLPMHSVTMFKVMAPVSPFRKLFGRFGKEVRS